MRPKSSRILSTLETDKDLKNDKLGAKKIQNYSSVIAPIPKLEGKQIKISSKMQNNKVLLEITKSENN